MLWRSIEPAEGDYRRGSALGSTRAVCQSLQKNTSSWHLLLFFQSHLPIFLFHISKFTFTHCWVQTSLCDGKIRQPLPQYWVCEHQTAKLTCWDRSTLLPNLDFLPYCFNWCSHMYPDGVLALKPCASWKRSLTFSHIGDNCPSLQVHVIIAPSLSNHPCHPLHPLPLHPHPHPCRSKLSVAWNSAPPSTWPSFLEGPRSYRGLFWDLAWCIKNMLSPAGDTSFKDGYPLEHTPPRFWRKPYTFSLQGPSTGHDCECRKMCRQSTLVASCPPWRLEL